MGKTVSVKTVLARAVRILSVPPLMVTTLILLLTFRRNDIFLTIWDPLAAFLTLALIPALAYPLSLWIPSVRRRGREGQRRLAFILSAAGYTLGFLYGLFFAKSRLLTTIFTTYLVSVIFLLAFHRLLHLRASGHACSVAGVLLMCAFFLSGAGVLASAMAYLLIFWASVSSGRHSAPEFLAGTLCCVLAFFVSWSACFVLPLL